MSHLHVQSSTQTLLATLCLLTFFFPSHLYGQPLGRPLPFSVVCREKLLFKCHAGWGDQTTEHLPGLRLGPTTRPAPAPVRALSSRHRAEACETVVLRAGDPDAGVH